MKILRFNLDAFGPFSGESLDLSAGQYGLHLVYGMVTRILGGRVTMESVHGAGTTFTVIMPMAAPDGIAAPAQFAEPAA